MTDNEDLFQQINNAVLDLQSAQLQSYHQPLKRLARLLRHHDLAAVNEKITHGLNIDAFLQGQQSRGGMIGSDRLEWPDDPEKVLGLTLLLIEKFADDPDFMAGFGHRYFYTGMKIMGDINAVTGQVIIPFARDYKAYVTSRGATASPKLTSASSNKVFVVHGHDTGARESVARFLESLEVEPIILLDQPNSGRTIIEKFEAHAATVNFAVILLTPDDLGGAIGSDHAERARQNVIYELGFFTGKLGRNRACLLRKGKVDIPSDLAGIVYTELDPAEGWKLKLIRELKAAGFNIDANKAMKY
jgi:predicted nucleotide-binding protein